MSSSSSLLRNGSIAEEAEDITRDMPKFPGSKDHEYSKLVDLNGAHAIIIWRPCKPIGLPNLPINGNGFAIILVTDGFSLERVSISELKEMGFGFSPALEEAVAAAGRSFEDGLELRARNSALEAVPHISLKQIGVDGSIDVSFATGVSWTVVGGLDQLWYNFEHFKELIPEIACQMPPLDILRATSGVSWTLSDAMELLRSFSERSKSSPCSTVGGIVASPQTNGQDWSISIGGLGSDDELKENMFYARFLSSPLSKMREILLTAGMNMDSQVGAAIIGIGVASPPVSQPNDDANHTTPLEYIRLVCYAWSCLFIFSSWMLNPTSRGSPAKEKRLKTLSHLTAGGAMIFLFAGVFCNIFAAVPLPFAVCAISTCVFFLLGAAGYNAFSK